MLTELCAAHRGRTAVFWFDVPWEETVRRHATRPQSAEFGVAEMREWFRPRDVLDLPGERLIPRSASVEEAVELVSRELAGAPQPAVAKRSRA